MKIIRMYKTLFNLKPFEHRLPTNNNLYVNRERKRGCPPKKIYMKECMHCSMCKVSGFLLQKYCCVRTVKTDWKSRELAAKQAELSHTHQ